MAMYLATLRACHVAVLLTCVAAIQARWSHENRAGSLVGMQPSAQQGFLAGNALIKGSSTVNRQ